MAKNIEHNITNDENNEVNNSEMRLMINRVGKLVDELNQECERRNTKKQTLGPTKVIFQGPKELEKEKRRTYKT